MGEHRERPLRHHSSAPPELVRTFRFVAAAVLVAALLIGCGRTPEAGTPEDQTSSWASIPHPSLEGAESGVREQIGGYRRTLKELEDSSDAKPETVARALGDLGLAYVLYNFGEAAEGCFARAHQLTPAEFRWSYLLGYAHSLQGEETEAVRWFEESLELEPGFLPALLRVGRVQLDLGDPEAARTWFEKALEIDSSSAAALEGLGKVSTALRDPAQAVEYFNRALALEPTASSLHYPLGIAHRSLGDLERARSELEAGGDVPVPIPDPLINPLTVAGESAQFYLIQGNEALKDHNYEAAAGAFGLALEKNPHSFDAYRLRGFALERLGDLEGAIAILDTALLEGSTGDPSKDERERAELHRLLGGLETLRRRDQDAIGHFEKSLELHGEQPGVRMKLGNSLAREGRFAEALPHFTAVLESHPELAADILVNRATALINLGRGTEALSDFSRAIKTAPEDGRLRLRYAEALEYLGQPQEAARQRAVANQATDAAGEPNRAGLLLEAATTALDRGEYQEALRHLAEVLDRDPDHLNALHQRGTVLGHLSRCEDALIDFRRVVEKAPRHSAARQGEIICLILQSRYGEARVRLNEALRIFTLDARLAHIQARLLATAPDSRVRDGNLALQVARRLVEKFDAPRVRETLALANAESGHFERAIEIQRALLAEAEGRGNDVLAKDFRAKLDKLESGQAWYASSPQEILDAVLSDTS